MTVIPFPKRPKNTEHYEGACPKCGDTSGCLNIGRAHWFRCDEHRTKWYVGENMYSGWREETEEEWRANRDRLAYYREVKPLEMTRQHFDQWMSRPQEADTDIPF